LLKPHFFTRNEASLSSLCRSFCESFLKAFFLTCYKSGFAACRCSFSESFLKAFSATNGKGFINELLNLVLSFFLYPGGFLDGGFYSLLF
jgi:hypothetical protein